MNNSHKSTRRQAAVALAFTFAFLFVSCTQGAGGSATANSNLTGNTNVESKPGVTGANATATPQTVISVADAEPAQKPVVQVNKDPKTLVLAFYEYYLDGFPRIDDEGMVFANFLTPRFFAAAFKANDYDPFVDAQDVDETWKNNFRADSAQVSGNRAKVKVSLRGKTLKRLLDVTVIKKGGVWKIDKVKNFQ